MFAHVKEHKGDEYTQGNDFLCNFELGQREAVFSAQVVGGYEETVFQECQGPAEDDEFPHGCFHSLSLLSQGAIPGEGHHDVTDNEQGNGEDEFPHDGKEGGGMGLYGAGGDLFQFFAGFLASVKHLLLRGIESAQ